MDVGADINIGMGADHLVGMGSQRHSRLTVLRPM